MKLGIDIGSTNTKIVIADNKTIIKKLFFYRSGIDSINLIENESINNKISGKDVVITGVGRSFINESSYLKNLHVNNKLKTVSEIDATAKGALTLANLEHALVVSCGTGTAFIHAVKDNAQHIGGSGVGGGTILGLSYLLNNEDDIEKIKKSARIGNTNNIDSIIGDITQINTNLLMPNVTASNFGKVISGMRYKSSDISSAILNLVYQTIAMLSVYAARSVGETNVILVGAMSESGYAKKVLMDVKLLHEDINFYIPDDGIYACALGATLL